MTGDAPFAATATAEGWTFVESDIRREELARARHALAHITRSRTSRPGSAQDQPRISNDAMRALLGEDIATITARVREWVEASAGGRQTGSVELVVPGPDAASSHRWYDRAMSGRRKTALRAGHPKHFVSHPQPGAIPAGERTGTAPLPIRSSCTSRCRRPTTRAGKRPGLSR